MITINMLVDFLQKKFPEHIVNPGVGRLTNLVLFDGEIMLSFPTKEQAYNIDITEEVLNDYVNMVERMIRSKSPKKGDSVI